MTAADPRASSPDEPALCYACDRLAVAECASCGQPYCEVHRGIEPRPEWCAECVANAKQEEALGYTFNGCALGCLVGFVVWLVALFALPALVFGPGRGFVIVLATGLFGAVVAYIVRRNQLFSPSKVSAR